MQVRKITDFFRWIFDKKKMNLLNSTPSGKDTLHLRFSPNLAQKLYLGKIKNTRKCSKAPPRGQNVKKKFTTWRKVVERGTNTHTFVWSTHVWVVQQKPKRER